VNFLAFPSVKFRKIWQIGSKYFTSVGARFSGTSIRPDFCSGKMHKFEKIEKTAFTNPTIFVLKIRIPLEAMCCKNFGRFHRRKFKFKKITNKAIQTVKNTFVWTFIIQD